MKIDVTPFVNPFDPEKEATVIWYEKNGKWYKKVVKK